MTAEAACTRSTPSSSNGSARKLVREVGDPPAPNLTFGGGYPSRSVQPPLQAGRPLQRRPRVRLLPDAVGIENAD